jgi:hypothetical protein
MQQWLSRCFESQSWKREAEGHQGDPESLNALASADRGVVRDEPSPEPRTAPDRSSKALGNGPAIGSDHEANQEQNESDQEKECNRDHLETTTAATAPSVSGKLTELVKFHHL